MLLLIKSTFIFDLHNINRRSWFSANPNLGLIKYLDFHLFMIKRIASFPFSELCICSTLFRRQKETKSFLS